MIRVCLDAGHGGRDSGAVSHGLSEDSIALDLITRIGHYVRAACGATVLTRKDDSFVEISYRARKAVTSHCDVFFSLHCNAASSKTARGCEAFVVEGDEKSKDLAESLLKCLVDIGMPSRGVKWDSQSQHPRLGVLRGTYRKMPAVLLEVGFLTNDLDRDKEVDPGSDPSLLVDKKWKDSLAQKMAKVLLHSRD